ncbi:MAG TPA: porin family protein [Caulobacter sp.]|nr:porin family protein [Caulobacter sp.]
MKKMIAAAAAAAALFGLPALAHAEAQIYGTIGYANIDVDPVNLGGIQARLGAQFNPHLAIEGEAAFGVQDDEILGVTVELSNEFAVFAVGKLPVSESVNLFARVGYSNTDIDVGGTSASGDGFAYGVGGEAFFTENDGVRFDWTKHDADGADADVWAIAYVRRF